MSHHPTYRPDIDGLRAIAILSVLVFHAFPHVLSGGFVGVDIFFVISGFLISCIIFADLQKGSFSFKVFYMRRVRRLFPALITVLSATFIAGWLLLFPDEFEQLGKHIAAGMGFIANFTLLNETGYFDKNAELKPLLHLWSLGIEEQFYIVWPLLLFCLWRWRKSVVPAALFLFVASMIYNVIEAYDDVEDAFFLPYSRFWEFSGGIALAYLLKFHSDKFHYEALVKKFPIMARWRVADLTSLAGVLCIIAAVFLFNKDMAFPGWYALLPVCGATLLIASRPAWFNRTILSSPPMVWIGLISYPLYLWHWPIISFLHITFGKDVTSSLMLGALGMSIILAWMTYRYIEMPVRRAQATRFIPHLCGIALIVAAFGLVVFDGKASPYINMPSFNKILAGKQDWDFPPQSTVHSELGEFRLDVIPGGADEQVLYLGDSNAQQYAGRIEEAIRLNPQTTYTAAFITKGGCRSIPNFVRKDRRECLDIIATAYEYIDKNPVVRVVLASRWHEVFSSESFYHVSPEGDLIAMSDPAVRQAVVHDMNEFVRTLKDKVGDVVIIHNIPTKIPEMDPDQLNRLSLLQSRWRGEEYGLSRTYFPEIERLDLYGRDILNEIASKNNVTIIDPLAYICPEGRCPLLFDGGRPVYKDSAHFAWSYANAHAVYMDQTILIGD